MKRRLILPHIRGPHVRSNSANANYNYNDDASGL